MVTTLSCQVKYLRLWERLGFHYSSVGVPYFFLASPPLCRTLMSDCSRRLFLIKQLDHVELLWKLRHYAYYLKLHQQNPKTRAQLSANYHGDMLRRQKKQKT